MDPIMRVLLARPTCRTCFRSSQRCLIKQVLKNFAIFTGSCRFIKKRLKHTCFPMNIAKFFRTPILKNICEWLLLMFYSHPNSLTQLVSLFHATGLFL